MASKKKKAFALFDKGYERNDPKVKEVVPNYNYRRNLWDMWKESHGVAPELVAEEPESVAEVATPEAEEVIETPEGRGVAKAETLPQVKAKFIPQEAFDIAYRVRLTFGNIFWYYFVKRKNGFKGSIDNFVNWCIDDCVKARGLALKVEYDPEIAKQIYEECLEALEGREKEETYV